MMNFMVMNCPQGKKYFIPIDLGSQFATLRVIVP
jgi:hypothetical protein